MKGANDSLLKLKYKNYTLFCMLYFVKSCLYPSFDHFSCIEIITLPITKKISSIQVDIRLLNN